ncbi:site-specific integrase [Micromonospora sp. RV43]|uniref:tyrosine-type recombinase/integrase n=1 Tax=Micromonospora sp. RV43 TaxID=1661387 RepID=UPI00064C234C|nr:site-specific integrase [Micromonospora sp. RV43]
MPLEEIRPWLDEEDIPDRLPCLIAPDGTFDLELNRYFLQVHLMAASENTQAAVAYDLANFFTFLWRNRQPLGCRSWRDATSEDRAAYKRWRRTDVNGPGVKGSTFAREVATVNQFYRWAVKRGLIAQNPIEQRQARHRAGRRPTAELTPAEVPRDAHRDDLEWLPPHSYRRWRDVGVRGYLGTGLRDRSFRGRNASRNATFCDVMVRTGLRLAEQASLTLFDVPDVQPHMAYRRTRLPSAIAKGGSGRKIYVPTSVLRDVWDYIQFDRTDVVERARARGTYERIEDALIIEDPQGALLPPDQLDGRPIPVGALRPSDRRRLLIRTEQGLEPAALWLTESGLPMTTSGWQTIFDEANDRCKRRGEALRCHPHLLRHTYAVVTLEQLQREHIRELAGMSAAQRTTYEMVFGDPLDWVRRRLGHQSIESTLIYLHTLNELAMETRLALVPTDWEKADYSLAESGADDAAVELVR